MSSMNLPSVKNPNIREIFKLEMQFPDKDIVGFYNYKSAEYESFINSILGKKDDIYMQEKYSEDFFKNFKKELEHLQNVKTHKERVQYIIKLLIQEILKENFDDTLKNTLKSNYVSVSIGYHIIQNKDGRDVLYYKDTNLHFIPNEIVNFLEEIEEKIKDNITIVDIIKDIVDKKIEDNSQVNNLIKQYTETYDNCIKWKTFKDTYEMYDRDIEKTLKSILSMNLWNQSKYLGEYIKFIKEGTYNFKKSFKIEPPSDLKRFSPKEIYEYFVVTVIESFFVDPSYVAREIDKIIQEKKLNIKNKDTLKNFNSILVSKPVYLYNIEPVGDVFLTVLLPKDNDKHKLLLKLLFEILLEEIFIEYSGITRNSYLEEERQKFALNSAMVAIMSRNGSHNIGSHVIYNVISNIDSLDIQDHKFFFRYLQHRFDFLAGITTYFLSNVNLISSHSFIKEIIRYFLDQKHILSYIALSEGLTFSNVEKNSEENDSENNKGSSPLIKLRKAKLSILGNDSVNPLLFREDSPPYEIINNIERNKENHGGIEILLCHGKDCKNNEIGEIDEDFEVDIPLGIIGFHAFYTIIENIIRNVSKHSYYPSVDKTKPLHISIDLLDCKEDEEYFHVVIWDNYSKISGLVNFIYKEIPNLEGKKIYLLNLQNKKLYEKTEEGFKEISEDNFTIENLIQLVSGNSNSDENIYFIIPNKEINLEGNENTNLYEKENVRIIPKWFINYEQIELNGGINHKYVDTLIKEFYEPIHIKLNRHLLKEVIDEKGELNKEYWGLKEMLIATSFLVMEDLRILNENSLWKLHSSLKAVPFYNKENKEYVLGFQFRIRKSKDILWLMNDEFISKIHEISPSLKKDGIYLVPKDYDLTFRKARHFVLIDENHRLMQLIDTNINKTYEIVEKFPGIRIGVIASEEKIKEIEDKIKDYKFLKFRLFFLEKEEFCQFFESSESKGKEDFTDLKVYILTKWLKHIISFKNLEKINLIFKPYSSGFEIPETNDTLKSEPKEKPSLSNDEDISNLEFLPIVESPYDNENCIIFKRHTDCNDYTKALYCEDISGSAPHFPTLTNIPRERDKKLYFVKSLIECGLFKIGIVDERFNETLQRKESLRRSLLNAGVYSINEFLGAKISSPYEKNSYYINIDNNYNVDMNIDIDILIIHQGFLDNKVNIKNINIQTMPNETKIDSIIRKLKKHIPLIYITSGRGVPNNMPKNVIFIPFGSIEQTLLSEPHSKYNLIKILI